MEKCIYFGIDMMEADFSREHIFSKGLGGMKRLPKTFVSKMANNKLSKIEEELFQGSSSLNLRRSFILRDKKSSSIYIFNKISLSYKNGKLQPNSFILLKNLNSNSISVSASVKEKINEEELYKIFTNIKEDVRKGYVKPKLNKNVSKGYAFIEFYKRDKKYNVDVIINPNQDFEVIKKYISSMNFKYNGSEEQKIGNFSMNIHIEDNLYLYYKFFSKICINILAHTFGKKFILNKEFDILKQKIFVENNRFINLEKDIDKCDKMQFKNQENEIENYNLLKKTNEIIYSSVFIYNKNNKLRADVEIMNFSLELILLENTEILKFEKTVFYILDYEKKREYFSKDIIKS